MTLSSNAKAFLSSVTTILATIAILGGLFAFGAAPKISRRDKARAIALDHATRPPRVTVSKVGLTAPFHTFVLPGSTVANQETRIYARAKGYLGEQRVDIGDSVSVRDVLAVIEAPEVQAELDEAKASLSQSQAERQRIDAELGLSKIRFAREQKLSQSQATSQETVDQREAEYKVALAAQKMASATIDARQAQIERLKQQIRFQTIEAPFDGVITERAYDVGALITADSPEDAPGLFRLSEIDRLRVIVEIPQHYATAISVGDEVGIFRVNNRQDRVLASVTRTSRSISPDARTLRVEVQIPNEDHRLLPGMYIEAEFKVNQPSRVLIPSGALITRGSGTKVAVLAQNNTVAYRDVTVLRDQGSSLELSAGLVGDETLIIRPGDDFKEGTVVDPVTTPS
ncbi:efflux RND transporter periplasmic adaptor subunit [Rhodopirellula sp. MGV]|uniref:efflux RND transporter periplasmic adaptor subunit n=1 Tax=Rhodopirellula sp. MGV TaxID=2023130 RepID=UPI000BC4AC20|nr:efflux RND transporter periplasmic adaptor subunit [Rhodopirellula sp. MGV]OYP32924.1 hypothetical protein CGZ80_18630 [Rhodopirellula sp. MGV]OYP39205.1 hypothetical protein CGZ80_00750 [Rhodopirellula sp. MGV]